MLVFVGGVDLSYACLEAMCELGFVPGLAVGYPKSRSHLSGFRDLGPLGDRYGFEVVRADNVNDPALVARIADLQPTVVFVIGWSQLVLEPLLSLPRYGCVGIHDTKLPEGRGRAPIPWTILKGLTETASTMFFLTPGVDDGPIIGQVPVQVDEREDAGTLYAKQLAAHVQLVREHTADLVAGTAESVPQDHGLATVWPRRTPEDGRIDWNQPAVEVDRLIRAVTRPYPGAFTEGVRIWKAEPGPDFNEDPGATVNDGEHSYVVCGTGSLRVLEADVLVRSARWHAFATV